MCDKVCVECPFREGSKYFRWRDEWAGELEKMREDANYQPDLPQGCHMIPGAQEGNNPFSLDPEKQCAGHIQYLKEKSITQGS